jgi:hypothetical protein
MIQISLVIKLVMAQQGASNSNFFGASWFVATNASFQISLVLTWSNASGAGQSNFIGYYAGYSAINAEISLVITGLAQQMLVIQISGASAGNEATNAESSNFFGLGAGNKCLSVNFFGGGAGSSATNANASNFFGFQAGMGATNAYSSNFLGQNAGLKQV